ncbi:MAG: imidazole glycerol phosphate synthase subunit HisH [Candidatus Micrarchaeota archaeon]
MITIIDYGLGNLRSVSKAFFLMGAEVVISNKIEDIANAEKLVLPGVGAFGDGMKNLRESGLDKILSDEVVIKKKPIIGLCLGMQLLAKNSTELGFNLGLGFINAEVKILESQSHKFKIPHVGWNEVSPKLDALLFKDLQEPSFYFVHSYQVVCKDPAIVAATCNYGHEFTAAVQQDNIFGVQFHPEKSQKDGLKLIENFINLKL